MMESQINSNDVNDGIMKESCPEVEKYVESSIARIEKNNVDIQNTSFFNTNGFHDGSINQSSVSNTIRLKTAPEDSLLKQPSQLEKKSSESAETHVSPNSQSIVVRSSQLICPKDEELMPNQKKSYSLEAILQKNEAENKEHHESTNNENKDIPLSGTENTENKTIERDTNNDKDISLSNTKSTEKNKTTESDINKKKEEKMQMEESDSETSINKPAENDIEIRGYRGNRFINIYRRKRKTMDEIRSKIEEATFSASTHQPRTNTLKRRIIKTSKTYSEDSDYEDYSENNKIQTSNKPRTSSRRSISRSSSKTKLTSPSVKKVSRKPSKPAQLKSANSKKRKSPTSLTPTTNKSENDYKSTFQEISENIYFAKKKTKKAQDYDDVGSCGCDMSYNCGSQCQNRILKIECNPDTCPCGSRCTNNRFQTKQWAGVEVRPTKMKGYGVFATEEIKKDSFVIEYVGEVLDKKHLQMRITEYGHKRHFYFMKLGANETIDASLKGNISRFINHSCSPNCSTQKWMVNGKFRVGLFALKDIPIGSEVTFDYCFEGYGEFELKCYCGSKNCRGSLRVCCEPKEKQYKPSLNNKKLTEKQIEKKTESSFNQQYKDMFQLKARRGETELIRKNRLFLFKNCRRKKRFLLLKHSIILEEIYKEKLKNKQVLESLNLRKSKLKAINIDEKDIQGFISAGISSLSPTTSTYSQSKSSSAEKSNLKDVDSAVSNTLSYTNKAQRRNRSSIKKISKNELELYESIQDSSGEKSMDEEQSELDTPKTIQRDECSDIQANKNENEVEEIMDSESYIDEESGSEYDKDEEFVLEDREGNEEETEDEDIGDVVPEDIYENLPETKINEDETDDKSCEYLNEMSNDEYSTNDKVEHKPRESSRKKSRRIL